MIEGVTEEIYKKVIEDYQSKPEFQTDAIKQIESRDGKVFLSQRLLEEKINSKVDEGIEKQKNNLKSTVSGNKEKEFSEAIKAITGVRWEDGENWKDYSQKAISDYVQSQMSNNGKADEAHVKGLSDQVDKLTTQLTEVNEKLTQKESEIFNKEIDSYFSSVENGLELDYDDYALKSIVSNLRNDYKNTFEIKNQDGEVKLINKKTGAELMNGNNPVNINDSYLEFVKGNSNIKFKQAETTLPNSNGNGDREANMSKYKDEINSRGIYEHVREAAELRKEYGVSTDKDKDVFSDLFE